MTGQIIPSSQPASSPAVNLGDLPEQLRDVMSWIIKQRQASLAEVIRQFNFYEPEAQGYLDALLQLGYLETVRAPRSGGTMVAASGASEPDTDLEQMLYQPSSALSRSDLAIIPDDIGPSQPLAAILSPKSELLVTPGTTTELSVTVINQGTQSAVIDVFLDDDSANIQTWCRSTQQNLALSPGQSGTVNFQFDVPIFALPGFYNYWLTVDAPQHYPDSSPLRYEHLIQVLTPIDNATQSNDPSFVLDPRTSSVQPAKAFANTPLQFQVIVYNRTDRVDRFRLTCIDLPSWIDISYPQGFQTPGLAIQENVLDLNPRTEGVILLTVTPPKDAIGTTYLATLRLRSENQPKLALFELLYIAVEPVHQIDMGMRTLVSHVRKQPGNYSVQVANHGNTPREIDLTLVSSPEDEPLFQFSLEKSKFKLEPGQTLTSKVVITPQKPLRRPLFGGGRVVNFIVEASAADGLPLPEIPMQGTLFWEARPWWQTMPLTLLSTGSILALFWFLWWSFNRVPRGPQVLAFSPESTHYSVRDNDSVRLNFQISHPKQVQTIEIIGLSPDGEQISGPIRFDLNDNLGKTLPSSCSQSRAMLTCRNIRTDAVRAATYQFQLTAIPKARTNTPPATAQTVPVEMLAIPLPQIVAVTPTSANYIALSPDLEVQDQKNSEILLNWRIKEANNLKAIHLSAKDAEGKIVIPLREFSLEQGLPDELAASCQLGLELICQNVSTSAHQAGTYIFELAAIPKQANSPDLSISLATEPIEIQARPLRFKFIKVNGRNHRDVTIDSPITAQLGSQPPTVLLEWAVANKTSETQVTLLPTPGKLEPEGKLAIPLDPTPGLQLLTLQVSNGAGEALIRTIPINLQAPAAPVLKRFLVNGRPSQPTYAIPLEPGKAPQPVQLHWEAEAHPGTQVSILPAPGVVGTQGVLAIHPKPTPGEQLITIQVVNAVGEKIARTISITTFDPNPNPEPKIEITLPGQETPEKENEATGKVTPNQPALVPNPNHPNQIPMEELPPLL